MVVLQWDVVDGVVCVVVYQLVFVQDEGFFLGEKVEGIGVCLFYQFVKFVWWQCVECGQWVYVDVVQYFVFDDVVDVGKNFLVEQGIVDECLWYGVEFFLGKGWILGIGYYVGLLVIYVVQWFFD